MYISSLVLKNFRNHSCASFDFSHRINVLEGDNGVGKTNIAEAIYYLSIARSFRGADNTDLIFEGKERGEIQACVHEGKIVRQINITIVKEGRLIMVGGKPIRKLSELSKCVNVVLFEPEDVFIFRGSPKARRNYLDISLSKKSIVYLDYISRYEKVLKQRNNILKSSNIDRVLLDATTEMLIKLSAPIIKFRQMYVKDINQTLSKIMHSLTGENKTIELVYEPFAPCDDKFIDTAKKAFEKGLDADLKKKSTSIGIHREDFYALYDGANIASHGSQGENRMAAIALKLAPYFLIEDKDKRPIVVLDDVMSELDSNHKTKLVEFLNKMDQVFITATNLKIDGAAIYKLKKKEKEVF